MTCKEAYFVVKVDDLATIIDLVVHMIEDEPIEHAGFKCKVTHISVKEEGSKQLSTYKLVATAKLSLTKKNENH
jgi:hypothetical protein